MTSKDILQYLQPLRRWWWLILASALISGISAFFYVRSQPVLYASSTTLMVGSPIQDPNPNNNEFYLTQILAGLYADMAKRSAVRTATMEALGLEWLPEYTAYSLPQSQVIEINVTDVEEERAQLVANELVRQLIAMSPAGQGDTERRNFVDQQLASLEQSILDTQDERVRLEETLASALSAREIRTIQDGIRALDEKLTTLQSNYAALLASSGSNSVNNIHVLEPASLPTVPIDRGAIYTILLAALFGAAIATVAAYALEFMNDVIMNVDSAGKFGLVPLGAVPTMTDTTDEPSRLVMLTDRYSSPAEAFRVLRTNLQFASVDKELQLIQITSPSVGEGKSLTAANLAIAIAQLGQQVILVDADLHQPTQHKYFQLVNNLGVTTALLGSLDMVEKMLKPTAVASLRVLPSGPLPPNPAELLGSKRMGELLDTLRDKVDVVVVDSPPVTIISDAVVLSTRMDGVLLVMRSGKTRQDSAKNAVDALKQVRANMLGFVLNGTTERSHGYYYRHRSDYGVQKHHQTLKTASEEGARLQASASPPTTKGAS